MKYKEVYLVLNQRKLDAPGFHYSDYSGWRAANQSYMTRQRPLWIVAEDPAAGRRMWICHDGSALSVTICKMNSEGHNCGVSHRLPCKNRTVLAATLRTLFSMSESVA